MPTPVNGEIIVFNKWSGGNQISTRKKNEVGPSTLHHIYKINSKWIKDLNVRYKVIKPLEESINGNLHDRGLGNGFLDMRIDS